MAMSMKIVGWHIHPETAKCACCTPAAPAVVLVELLDDEGFPISFDLCQSCLDKAREVNTIEDQIEETFKKLGF